MVPEATKVNKRGTRNLKGAEELRCFIQIYSATVNPLHNANPLCEHLRNFWPMVGREALLIFQRPILPCVGNITCSSLELIAYTNSRPNPFVSRLKSLRCLSRNLGAVQIEDERLTVGSCKIACPVNRWHQHMPKLVDVESSPGLAIEFLLHFIDHFNENLVSISSEQSPLSRAKQIQQPDLVTRISGYYGVLGIFADV